MWKSDKCRTFKRLPDGFFAAGSGLGFGFANQPARSKGDVGGSGQRSEMKWLHIAYIRCKGRVIPVIKGTTSQEEPPLGRHYLSIKAPNISRGDNLSDRRAESLNAKLRWAIAVEVEVLTQAHRKLRPELRRCQREELGSLEPRLALCAGGLEVRVVRNRQDLLERGL